MRFIKFSIAAASISTLFLGVIVANAILAPRPRSAHGQRLSRSTERAIGHQAAPSHVQLDDHRLDFAPRYAHASDSDPQLETAGTGAARIEPQYAAACFN